VRRRPPTVGATAALAMTLALTAPTTAPAHADCGDPGKPVCVGPVPSTDQVVAVLSELTDPGRPAASKSDAVTPGLAPDEAGTADDHLNRLNGRGFMPFNFVVTDIQPALGNSAGATVTVQSNRPHTPTDPTPIVLVDEGGRWLVTHDAAIALLNAVWNRYRGHFVG
jgi:hypothetical protein